jgi:hypothetical protein
MDTRPPFTPARAESRSTVTDHIDPNESMVSPLHPVTVAPRHEAPTARYLTSDEFFALTGELATEEVFVPRLNRSIIVSELTADEVVEARQAIVKTAANGRTVPRDDRDFSAMIAYLAARNPDGSRFFRRDQIDMLNRKTGYAAIQPISRAALRLSGLDDEAEELARKKHLEGSDTDDER